MIEGLTAQERKERTSIAIASALLTVAGLPPGRETALVRTKLEESAMWLEHVPCPQVAAKGKPNGEEEQKEERASRVI